MLDSADSSVADPLLDADDPDGRWAASASRVGEWLEQGGYPGSPREDLLRDVVALWDDLGSHDPAWDATAGALTTLMRLAARPGAVGAYAALVDALDAHVAGGGASEDARWALEELLAALGDAASSAA